MHKEEFDAQKNRARGDSVVQMLLICLSADLHSIMNSCRADVV